MPEQEPTRRARPRTATSNHGVSRREGHDASAFYARFSSPALSTDTTVNACDAAGRLIVGDARDMSAVPDNSVALVATSPPYFAGKAYEEDLTSGRSPASYLEYLEMLHSVFAEAARTLEPGGRMAVNVANLGRRPYRSLSADVTRILADELGLLPVGEIVWVKAEGATGVCSWGSWCSPSAPTLRDVTERILVAAKGRFNRAVHWNKRRELGLPWEADIERDEFMAATLDTWYIRPESAKRIGHPAPFPVPLVERLLRLYTYRGDVVLDPFMGSGTTAVAAVRTGRRWVGYELDPAYAERAQARIDSTVELPRPGDMADPPTTPAA